MLPVIQSGDIHGCEKMSLRVYMAWHALNPSHNRWLNAPFESVRERAEHFGGPHCRVSSPARIERESVPGIFRSFKRRMVVLSGSSRCSCAQYQKASAEAHSTESNEPAWFLANSPV